MPRKHPGTQGHERVRFPPWRSTSPRAQDHRALLHRSATPQSPAHQPRREKPCPHTPLRTPGSLPGTSSGSDAVPPKPRGTEEQTSARINTRGRLRCARAAHAGTCVCVFPQKVLTRAWEGRQPQNPILFIQVYECKPTRTQTAPFSSPLETVTPPFRDACARLRPLTHGKTLSSSSLCSQHNAKREGTRGRAAAGSARHSERGDLFPSSLNHDGRLFSPSMDPVGQTSAIRTLVLVSLSSSVPLHLFCADDR